MVIEGSQEGLLYNVAILFLPQGPLDVVKLSDSISSDAVPDHNMTVFVSNLHLHVLKLEGLPDLPLAPYKPV